MRALFLLLVVSTAAFAQHPKPANQPKTEFVFEGDLIEGTDQTPDVGLETRSKRAVHHSSLLKPRTDFRREAMESVSQL